MGAVLERGPKTDRNLPSTSPITTCTTAQTLSPKPYSASSEAREQARDLTEATQAIGFRV